MSEGVTPTVRITMSAPCFAQGLGTAIAGRQPEHMTGYSLAHPTGAATAAGLSKIEEIVEYLKALYR